MTVGTAETKSRCIISGGDTIAYYQYQNYYPQHYQQNQQNVIVWVQGIEGAKAYPVASGASVLLMDSEENVFYIKSTDQSGMPSPLRIFDYAERKEEAQKVDTSQFITRDEFEQKISELKRKPKEKKNEPSV